MALQGLFSCGDEYGTGTIPDFWASVINTVTVVSGRNGGNALSFSDSAVLASGISVPLATPIIVGMAVKLSTGQSASPVPLALSSSFGSTASLEINTDGSVSMGGASSASGKYVFGQYNYLEAVNNVTGSYPFQTLTTTLYVNGGLVATGTQSGSYSTGAPITGVQIGDSGGHAVGDMLIDDMYVCDNTGSYFNAPTGDLVISVLLANGNGRINQWANNGAPTNWQAVSQVPPNLMSYVADGTVGDTDTYALATISGYAGIAGVSVQAVMEQDATGTRAVALGLGNGSSEVYGTPNVGLTTSYAATQIPFSSNPLTSAAWDVSDFPALQAAIQVAV